jgi:hypothetical protein
LSSPHVGAQWFADRIPNPRHEGSTPSTDAFRHSRIPTRTIDNWTFIAFPQGPQCPGEDQLWASGQATSFGMRRSGVRVPPAGPGARRMLATGRAGATDVPCDGNPHDIRRRAPERPWLNRTERLPTKQEGAGSSPAGRAVSEAEAADAPGRGPGGSGFEPRRTPSVRRAHAL